VRRSKRNKTQTYLDSLTEEQKRRLLRQAGYSSLGLVINKTHRKKIKRVSHTSEGRGHAMTMGELLNTIEDWERETGWKISDIPCHKCGKPSTRFHTFLKDVTLCDSCEDTV